MGANDRSPGPVSKPVSRFPRVECDPQIEGRKLADKLRDQERELVERTPTGSRKVILVVGDKKNQNPINYFGTPSGAGDASLEAYFYMIEVTASIVAKHYGMRHADGFCARVSRASDETVFVFSSRTNLDHFRRTFRAAYKDVRDKMVRGSSGVRSLGSFKYDLAVGGELVTSALSHFARLLRYPEAVISSNFTFSPKATMTARSGPGTLYRLVHTAEQKGLAFRTLLPDSIRFDRISREEIASPFPMTLESMCTSNWTGPKTGTYLEIRFDINPESTGLMKFIRDGWDGGKAHGTRKGFDELLSGNAGMRWLNTFCGHDGANGAVSVVADAMNYLSVREGVPIIPVDGGHLRYYVDGDILGLEQKIKAEIRAALQRLHQVNRKATGLRMDVDIRSMSASSVDISGVRDSFILDALNLRGSYPLSVVEHSNFLVSFFEIASEGVRNSVLDSIHASDSDWKMTSRMREIFQTHRTIRNLGDVLAVLRHSDSVPLDTRVRAGLENWFLDFAMNQKCKIERAIRALLMVN